ncbi:PilZ domain-containing protein [Halobacillus yeomjeoni]|uniref:PilZ domain-containing protein n=1 Tax=Halobacillus yeomjeoni TaxID=311194 RepID=UPI001CD6901E|nr:PilZ domain-containing protein [Halobacillus yeomjeoni]MCA0985505.1 PilZ domain-containing protein [Halobacillus yeomjeoni]
MRDNRRKEFRYIFQEPLSGYYTNKKNRRVSGSMKVVDISLNGMRFSCATNNKLVIKDEIFISFIYKNETITAQGRIIWIEKGEETMSAGLYIFKYPERFQSVLRKLSNLE